MIQTQNGGGQFSRGTTPVRLGTNPSRRTPPDAKLAVRLLRLTGNGSLLLMTTVVSALIEGAESKPCHQLSLLLSDERVFSEQRRKPL